MAQLTPFQQSCEWALLFALKAVGLTLVDRQETGDPDTYISATVGGTDVLVYMYAREAQIHNSGKPPAVYALREIYSPLRLQGEFVQSVLQAVAESRATSRKMLGRG